MGYRYELVFMEKEKIEKFKKFTKKDYYEYAKNNDPDDVDDDGYVYSGAAYKNEERYELGKMLPDKFYEYFREHRKPLFTDEIMKEHFAENDCWIMPKEAMLELIYNTIEIERNYRFEYTKKFLELFDEDLTEESRDELKTDLLNRYFLNNLWQFGGKIGGLGYFKRPILYTKQEIDNMKLNLYKDIHPYNLLDKWESIAQSDKWCYEAFEILRLYKTIDWDKYDLILIGG